MLRIRTTVGMLAVSALAAVAMAENTATSGKLLRMQPGEGVFTILDNKGVRPMPGSELSVRDMQDGEAIVKAVANEAGRAVVELTEGRFILSVDQLNLSVLDVSADAAHTECRIVMPLQNMLVGGQAEGGTGAAGAGGAAGDGGTVEMGRSLMTPVVIGGALVLVGGVAYAIDENSGSSRRDPVTVVQPVVQTGRRATPPSP